MFQSIYTIGISMALTTLVIVSLILRRNPISPAIRLLEDVITHRVCFWHFAALASVLILNKIELKVEQELVNLNDFTSSIHQFEGNLVFYIQHLFHNDILTYVLTFFYIIVFTSLMIASFVIYYAEKDFRSFYALFYGIMINYMIAIPFYLFFPVNEVWYHLPEVYFLIPEVYPAFEQEYRLLSGLNNCFPSLHTSLSLTMALIAIRSKNVGFGKLAAGCAFIIIFSILYLGIHWISDMAAGTFLAIFASAFALKLSEYNEYHFNNSFSVKRAPSRF